MARSKSPDKPKKGKSRSKSPDKKGHKSPSKHHSKHDGKHHKDHKHKHKHHKHKQKHHEHAAVEPPPPDPRLALIASVPAGAAHWHAEHVHSLDELERTRTRVIGERVALRWDARTKLPPPEVPKNRFKKSTAELDYASFPGNDPEKAAVLEADEHLRRDRFSGGRPAGADDHGAEATTAAIAAAARSYSRAGSTTEGHTLAVSLSASAAASCLVPVDDVATFKLAGVATFAQSRLEVASGASSGSVGATLPSLGDASLGATLSVPLDDGSLDGSLAESSLAPSLSSSLALSLAVPLETVYTNPKLLQEQRRDRQEREQLQRWANAHGPLVVHVLDAVTTLSDWSMDFSEGKSTKAAAAAAAVQAQMLSMVAQGGAPTEAATEDVDPGATAADGGAAAASGVGGVGGVVDRSGASGRVKGGPVTTLSPAKQLGLPGAIAPPPRPRGLLKLPDLIARPWSLRRELIGALETLYATKGKMPTPVVNMLRDAAAAVSVIDPYGINGTNGTNGTNGGSKPSTKETDRPLEPLEPASSDDHYLVTWRGSGSQEATWEERARVPPNLLDAFEKGLGEDWDDDEEEEEEKKEGGKQQEHKEGGEVGGRGGGGARLDVAVAVEQLSFTLRYIPTPLPVSESSRVAADDGPPDHSSGPEQGRPGPGDPFGSSGGGTDASGGIGETAGRGLVTRPRTGGTVTGAAGVSGEGDAGGTRGNVGGASDKLIAVDSSVEIPPGLLALGRYMDAILNYRDAIKAREQAAVEARAIVDAMEAAEKLSEKLDAVKPDGGGEAQKEAAGEEEQEEIVDTVVKVLNHRTSDGKYLVVWKGSADKEPTWAEASPGFYRLIEKFEQGLSQSDDEEDDSVDAAEGSAVVVGGGETDNKDGEMAIGKEEGKGEGKGAEGAGVAKTAVWEEDDDVEPLEPPIPPLIEQAMERWNVIGTENLLRPARDSWDSPVDEGLLVAVLEDGGNFTKKIHTIDLRRVTEDVEISSLVVCMRAATMGRARNLTILLDRYRFMLDWLGGWDGKATPRRPSSGDSDGGGVGGSVGDSVGDTVGVGDGGSGEGGDALSLFERAQENGTKGKSEGKTKGKNGEGKGEGSTDADGDIDTHDGGSTTRVLDLSEVRLTSRDAVVVASLINLKASEEAEKTGWIPAGMGVPPQPQLPPGGATVAHGESLPPMAVMVAVEKLEPKPISRLDLARNQIGSRFNPISVPQATYEPNPWATAMLTEAMLTQPHLTAVDLSSNQLEKSAARVLGPLLAHPALTHLTVDDNPLGSDGLASVVAALQASPSLVLLSLRSCCGRSDGGDAMTAVSSLLTREAPAPPSFTKLDLSGNWARTKGAQALTKAIRTGTFHFRELILRDNEIVESGIVGLVLQGFGERPGACGTLDLRGNESRLAVATRIKRKLEASVEVKIQETAELEKKRAERREKMTGVVQLKDERQRPVLWL